MRQHAPVFPPVSPVLRSVFSVGLFLRYFNDLSCIWRAPTPCKSPVFFYSGLFTILVALAPAGLRSLYPPLKGEGRSAARCAPGWGGGGAAHTPPRRAS